MNVFEAAAIGFNALRHSLRNPILVMLELVEKAEQKSQEKKKARTVHILKYYKIEITETFWGKKVRMIQRDTPLTDDQLKEYLCQS